MSILIKGMEMPKNCEACPCSYWTEGAYRDYCQIKGWKESNELMRMECRPSWCPLIELPPHGDLIDRDELRKAFESYNFLSRLVYKIVEDAPVVVVADNATTDCATTCATTWMPLPDAPTVIESTMGQVNDGVAVNKTEGQDGDEKTAP